MNRNILKLTSMLLVGLALATSCSKDKPGAGSTAKPEAAERAADGTANTIGQFNTATPEYDSAGKVRTEALMLLAVVRERADEAKSEVSEAAKAELDKAIRAVDAYKASALATAVASNTTPTSCTPAITAQDGEKTAAKKVADEVLAAIKKAKTL